MSHMGLKVRLSTIVPHRERGSRTMKKLDAKYKKRRLAALVVAVFLFAGLGLVGYSLLAGGSPAVAESPARVDGVPVYDAPESGYEKALHDGVVHVRGTGFPWQKVANVYIAGHRVGYPGTKSNLVFWDLNKLEKGDEIFLTDADGTRYTYEVFEKGVISPNTVNIMRPTKGKNIVSLQTCTLPDYSH